MQHQLGETIRNYRKQKGYTISELTDKLDISTGLLSNIENAKTDFFQLNLLNNIIQELDIPLSELHIFSKPYPTEGLDIDNMESFNKMRSKLEIVINAFIKSFSTISDDEDKMTLITSSLVNQIQIFNKLIEAPKSK
ncbi:helix-turn-helix domain-containing protein [Clostridium sp. BSD9I1]|uniref:helix-turn-helix domain-containing protein n=1 Tax=Clostridium sp. BSD9I1 TaxID=2003589 RepID=UPI001645AECD|nr:helix-turn-helix transcriptional regulator [Clostridium sp. BSD9I1]